MYLENYVVISVGMKPVPSVREAVPTKEKDSPHRFQQGELSFATTYSAA